jgi:hypothetical protein
MDACRVISRSLNPCLVSDIKWQCITWRAKFARPYMKLFWRFLLRKNLPADSLKGLGVGPGGHRLPRHRRLSTQDTRVQGAMYDRARRILLATA